MLIAGDLNVAPEPIDVWEPKRTAKLPGCLPHERAWIRECQPGGLVLFARNVYGQKIFHRVQDYPWTELYAFHSMFFTDTMACGSEWACWDGTAWRYQEHHVTGSLRYYRKHFLTLLGFSDVAAARAAVVRARHSCNVCVSGFWTYTCLPALIAAIAARRFTRPYPKC